MERQRKSGSIALSTELPLLWLLFDRYEVVGTYDLFMGIVEIKEIQ